MDSYEQFEATVPKKAQGYAPRLNSLYADVHDVASNVSLMQVFQTGTDSLWRWLAAETLEQMSESRMASPLIRSLADDGLHALNEGNTDQVWEILYRIADAIPAS